MTKKIPFARIGAALAAAGVLLGMLSACTPQPEPTPTKTALFASDEEAFAAAEETYRGYVAASNRADMKSPETFEPVFDWLVGSALTSARESYSKMHADGLTMSGTSSFDDFELTSLSADAAVAELCLDVSAVDLVNIDGVSVVPQDRIVRQRIEIELIRAKTPSGLAIERSTVVGEPSC